MFGLSVIDRVSASGTTIASNRSFVTTLPLSNVATRQLSQIARTLVDTDDTIRLDFTNAGGFGVNPIVAILANSTASEAYNITIKGSLTALGNTDVFQESYILNRPGTVGDELRDEFPLSLFEYIEAADSATYIRIEIEAQDGDQTFDFGRVWIGPSVSATDRNIMLVGDLRMGGSVAKSVGQQGFGSTGTSVRVINASFQQLTSLQRMTVLRALAYAGQAGELVLMANTSTAINDATDYHRDNSYYGAIEGDVSYQPSATLEINTVSFTVVEER